MPDSNLREQAIADVEWVLAWLKNDEPLPVAACALTAIVLRLSGKRKPH